MTPSEKNKPFKILGASAGFAIILLAMTTYCFFFKNYFLLANPGIPEWNPVVISALILVLLEALFFLLMRTTQLISFSNFLRRDWITLIPSFFLLVSLVYFPHSDKLGQDKILKIMLGYVFTIIIFLKAFFYFHFSFKSLMEKTAVSLTKILFFAFLFFYAFLSLWTLTAIGPTGDEPMYLLETYSLAKDHDFDISNNLIHEDYRTFYDGQLPFTEYVKPGKPYYFGIRFAGLPLLILPGFLIAGKYGSGFIMAIIASLFAVNIFLLIEDLLEDRKTALLVAIAAAFSIPLIFFSSRIYPDVPAALLLVFAFRKITKENAAISDMILAGLSVALMPWFHHKFLLPAVMAAIAAIIINRKKMRNILSFLAIPILSAAGYIPFLLHYFYLSEGIETSASSFTWHIYRYSLALFFDGEGGLFWFSPLFITSMAGAYFYIRKKEKSCLPILFIILPVLALLGGFKNFQGGYGLARPLIIILPFLALFAANYVIRSKNAKAYWVFAAPCFILSLLLTGLPWLIENNRNGKNIFLEFIDKMLKMNISGILPTFEAITAKTYLLTFSYGVIFVLISILLIKREIKVK